MSLLAVPVVTGFIGVSESSNTICPSGDFTWIAAASGFCATAKLPLNNTNKRGYKNVRRISSGSYHRLQKIHSLLRSRTSLRLLKSSADTKHAFRLGQSAWVKLEVPFAPAVMNGGSGSLQAAEIMQTPNQAFRPGGRRGLRHLFPPTLSSRPKWRDLQLPFNLYDATKASYLSTE
jgi:hypothetical protein